MVLLKIQEADLWICNSYTMQSTDCNPVSVLFISANLGLGDVSSRFSFPPPKIFIATVFQVYVPFYQKQCLPPNVSEAFYLHAMCTYRKQQQTVKAEMQKKYTSCFCFPLLVVRQSTLCVSPMGLNEDMKWIPHAFGTYTSSHGRNAQVFFLVFLLVTLFHTCISILKHCSMDWNCKSQCKSTGWDIW